MSTATHPRPLLGLRRRPGRLALAAMRLPRPLYRRGWGRLLGHTFLLIAHPALEIQIGGERYVPEQRFVAEDEAVAVALEFRRRHPWRLRLFRALLGWDLRSDSAVREFVRTRPFVAFRPTP